MQALLLHADVLSRPEPIRQCDRCSECSGHKRYFSERGATLACAAVYTENHRVRGLSWRPRIVLYYAMQVSDRAEATSPHAMLEPTITANLFGTTPQQCQSPCTSPEAWGIWDGIISWKPMNAGLLMFRISSGNVIFRKYQIRISEWDDMPAG